MYDVPDELTRPGTARCALREYRAKKGARHSETWQLPVEGTNLSPSMLVEFGGGRIVEVSRQPLKGGGWVSLHEDITERRKQQERIAHLARHDGLTGLANRMLFRERLEHSLQRLGRGQGFAVLCLDLDHFKAVNDTHGHQVGDRVLLCVAQRLVEDAGDGNFVARVGGEEFAVLYRGATMDAALERMAATLKRIAGLDYVFTVDGAEQRLRFTCSAGITEFTPGENPEDAVKRADRALYEAKRAGKNRAAGRRKGLFTFLPWGSKPAAAS
jgi:diguanylate cyclase (GGDEF)-like protein